MSTIRTTSSILHWAGAATDRRRSSRDTSKRSWPTPTAGMTAWWWATTSPAPDAGRTRGRKFVDAEKTHPQIAAEAVGWIKRLYAVEERGKALDVAARLALRQQESTPILSSLKDRLFTWRDQLLPKHPMAEAVGYLLNQWNELNVFTTDGAVPIDNNVSEREMKRICLNRKNSLFVGNERGGQTAAILSSLTSTCRRHSIDPQRYLTQLLTNLPATPISQLSDWLPEQWQWRNSTPSG